VCAGFKVHELKSFFDAPELKQAGVTVEQLTSNKFELSSVLAAEFAALVALCFDILIPRNFSSKFFCLGLFSLFVFEICIRHDALIRSP
jgi:hypothetical protein